MSGRHPMGGGPTQKPANFKASALRLFKYLLRDKVLLVSVISLGVLATALSVVGPKVLGHATDIVFAGFTSKQFPSDATKAGIVASMRESGNGRIANMIQAMDITPGAGIDFGALGWVLVGAAAIYAVAAVFMLFQGRMATVVVQRTVAMMRDQVEAKLSKLPLSYFDVTPRGEVLSRTTNDIDNIAQSLQQSMSQLLTSFLTVIGVLAMMFYISPLLALVAVVTVPFAVFITKTIAGKSQPQFIAQWSKTGHLNGHIEEVFTGHEVVKIFGRQEESREIFDDHNQAVYEASFKAQFISGVISPTMMFVSNLNYVAVAVIGALRIGSGAISVGDVQAFVQYSRQFTQPLTQLASMVNLLQSGVASAERVFGFLDEEEERPDRADALIPDEVFGRVAFEDVSFSYTPDEPLIEHLDLTADPGQTIAIVGHTGAGKTTLTNLVLRFYELDGGRITFDGIDIAEMNREVLRRNFGVVLQDTWLFGGTIAENISYGATGASEEEMIEAATAANVDHFVRTLPQGYDTIIDDEGTNISAGQRQLLTIARAFLANPSVLVLDEATSSVDTRTETLVQHAMERLRARRTSFVIAHRLSTIRDADRIVVMEEGRIVEQGTHDELIAANGAYQRLYAAQFAGSMA